MQNILYMALICTPFQVLFKQFVDKEVEIEEDETVNIKLYQNDFDAGTYKLFCTIIIVCFFVKWHTIHQPQNIDCTPETLSQLALPSLLV